jgi:hypothetical protein
MKVLESFLMRILGLMKVFLGEGVCVKDLWRCVVWLLVWKYNVCAFMWKMYNMLQFCFAFILDMLGLGALKSLDKK